MSFSPAVRDLGVLLDLEHFSHHIDQVCHSCYYQLRHLRVIVCSLTFNTAVSLVHTFVFSYLDYCSSIFAGLPGVQMEKLRQVYQAVARLIDGFKKFDHISQYLFVHPTRVLSVSLSAVPPLGRIELSRSWDPRPGMVFHLRFASFLGPYLSRSFLV